MITTTTSDFGGLKKTCHREKVAINSGGPKDSGLCLGSIMLVVVIRTVCCQVHMDDVELRSNGSVDFKMEELDRFRRHVMTWLKHILI